MLADFRANVILGRGGHLAMNKFIRQNAACPTSFFFFLYFNTLFDFMVSYNTCTYCCYEQTHTHTLHLQETRYTSTFSISKHNTINYNLHTQYKDFNML